MCVGCLRQLTSDMSKYRGELSEREKELLLIRRASGAQASQLAHMEKMLSQTKGLLEKKTETGTEGKAREGDTTGLYRESLVCISLHAVEDASGLQKICPPALRYKH